MDWFSRGIIHQSGHHGAALERGMQISMDDRGLALDDALVERLWRTVSVTYFAPKMVLTMRYTSV